MRRDEFYLFFLLLLVFCVEANGRQSNDQCPVFTFCPEACKKTTDSHGCVGCFCEDTDDKSEEKLVVAFCSDPAACPAKCSLKIDHDNCTKCVCPEISIETNALSPELPDVECNDTKLCNSSNTRCLEDGYAKNATNNTCYRLPRLGETCRVNGTVLRCFGVGVKAHCNIDSDKTARCECESLHEPNSDGTYCELRTRYLGDNCAIDTDCFTAHSECRDGKCECQDGFANSGTKCLPKEYKCPAGKALNDGDGDNPRKCEYRDGAYDTCPTGSFCFLEPRTLTINGSSTGYCCLSKIEAADPACPVGQPFLNATCVEEKLAESEVVGSADKSRLCPSTSHECISHQSMKGPVASCCPVPCRQGSRFFAHDGKCYQYAAIGDRCEIQAQCIGGSRCVGKEDKRQCKCPSRFTQIFQSYCKPPVYEDAAPLNQIQSAEKRKPSSFAAKKGIGLLGQPCDRASDCVTAYATCAGSKICTCSSGFVARGNKWCEPQEYRCPLGQPLRRPDGGILPCYYASPDITAVSTNHTCPPSYFCYRYPDTKTINGNAVGHCCKEPTADETPSFDVVCPIADPLLSGTCPRLSARTYRDLEAKVDKSRACPYGSHVCYFHFMSPNDQPCCPKPCRQSPNHFAADGTCYERAYTGQPCSIDAQCATGRCGESLGGGRICD